jgi:hypothetical protein
VNVKACPQSRQVKVISPDIVSDGSLEKPDKCRAVLA